MKLNKDQFDEIMRKFPDSRFIKTPADKVVFYRTYEESLEFGRRSVDHYIGMTNDPDNISLYQDIDVPKDAELYVNINGNDYLLNIKCKKTNPRAYAKGFDDGYGRAVNEIRGGVWR